MGIPVWGASPPSPADRRAEESAKSLVEPIKTVPIEFKLAWLSSEEKPGHDRHLLN